MDLKLIQILLLTLIHANTSNSSPTYHLLSDNGIPAKDPYHKARTPFKQQCVSICATTATKCRSFVVREDAGTFECLFFDVTTGQRGLVQATDVQYFIDIQSCQDWYLLGARSSEVYEVNLMGKKKTKVRCNMEVNGGGWMVIFRKKLLTSENFERSWDEYREGFGDVATEFRLGNERIHKITNSGKYYIMVWAKDGNDQETTSKYGSFYIENEKNDYRIRFDKNSLEGNTSFEGKSNEKNVNGFGFSTDDIDNDGSYERDCAGDHGPSWYNACSQLSVAKNSKLVWYQVSTNLQIMEWMIKEM